MYQKIRFSHKYLIISIYMDFLRFSFPFFYIRWLMGYMSGKPYNRQARLHPSSTTGTRPSVSIRACKAGLRLTISRSVLSTAESG